MSTNTQIINGGDVSTKSNPAQSESNSLRFSMVLENVGMLLKSSGLLIWFIVFLLALLEIKRYYNIDVIPNYDSSLDDTYGFVRGTISEFFQGK